MGSISSESRSDIIYRSKLPDIDIPNHLPLHTYCFQNLPSHGNRPCLIDGATGATLTHADVHLTARKVATGLRRLGVRKNHVIMLLLPNSPEFVLSFLAASFLGAASTTANPLYTAAEIHKQAKLAGAKLIITKSSHVDKLHQLVNDLGVKIVCTDEAPEGCVNFSELSSSEKLELELDFDPTDVVALPFSSGTTGLPKGVMLTHRGLVTSVAQQVDGDNPNIYLRSDDVILCVLPLFHIYSLVSIMLCGLRVGAAIVIVPKFDVVEVMELVERNGVTVAPFVPPIVVAIAKSPVVDDYDMSSVRMVVCGAAPLGKDLEDAVKAKLPNATLGQGYGMTEAGAALSMCLAFAKEPFEVKSAACGTVVRNAELKIVDIETGVSLPRNQPGEIQIRSQAIMKGYINDPEATSQTIDKDGWLQTGDIGYVDDDDEIFIIDRLKEIIKYKGYQVPPAEIEALLVAHPYIVEAAVVPMKDELAGELPVAFVIRSDGSNITEYEIKKHVSEQVVFYKRVHRVFFVDSILKAPSGKILRKDLKAKLAAGLFC